MNRILNCLAIAAVCGTLIAFTGCGDSTKGSCTGKITVDGQPVSGLVLTFNPDFDGGTISSGMTDAEGNYTAMLTHSEKGVLVGKHHITFEYNYDEGNPNMVDAGIKIPKDYTSADTTPCTIEITSGSNDFSYDIVTKE